MKMSPQEKEEIERLIDKGNNNLKELIISMLAPLQSKVEKHEAVETKVITLEERLNNHIDNHQKTDSKKQFNISQLITVLTCLLIAGITIFDLITK